MNQASCFVSSALFALASLSPAQNEGKPAEKPKVPAAAEKKESQSPAKDDLAMAKDPAVIGLDKFIAKKPVDKNSANWRHQLVMPPLQAFDPNTDYFWNMETSKGPLVIKLFQDTAPVHVTSAIYLARLGYYDGLKFHRIIKGFMAQGGCPDGNGGGGPGYSFDGEFYGTRKHDKPGILSMANAGPKTDGSQFFLTFVPTPHLDGKHTIWGEVVDGMDTLKALEAAGSEGDGKLADVPTIVKTWISVKKNPPKPKDDKAPAKADSKPAKPEEKK